MGAAHLSGVARRTADQQVVLAISDAALVEECQDILQQEIPDPAIVQSAAATDATAVLVPHTTGDTGFGFCASRQGRSWQ